jgi:RES domain-containing protein
MDRSLAVRVARGATCTIDGVFERHVNVSVRTLTGSAAGGRWGPPGAYPVLYLGRPIESIVVEAYRHLVDDVEGMTPEAVGPRRIMVAKVHVTNILDLRAPESRNEIGVTMEDLAAEHEPCQAIGLAAHQLELHGVIAPAATGLGETLALFERHIAGVELPVLLDEWLWDKLPPDPRVPRLVEELQEGADS